MLLVFFNVMNIYFVKPSFFHFSPITSAYAFLIREKSINLFSFRHIL